MSHNVWSPVTVARSAKILARILRRRIEKKIEDVLGEDQFGFERWEGTGNTLGTSKWTLDINWEMCACFIDWQKASDFSERTKLMQIVKETVIDWHARRLIRKLHVDRSAKVWVHREEIRSWRWEQEWDNDTDPLPIVQEAGWAPGLVWLGTRNLTLDPSTIYPVERRYKNCSVLAYQIHPISHM
jgi:hypothetical protein